jgi:hypothetical protein
MQIELPDPIQRRDFENQARWMDSGVPPLKTYEVVPTAYTLSIRRTSWEVGKLAYLYDAAGEAYSDENKTLQQTYYKYVHALLLVIDPFSIADFARQHESEIKTARDALRPSPTNPIEAYERMLAALESVAGLQRGRPFRQPLAVVLTKTDASDLENRVGSPAAHRLMLAQPWLHREQDAMHLLVERFLTEMGMGNLVRDMSMQFSNLRFFSCSALGRLPDFSDRKPYRPLRAVDPFLWLLGQLNAISLREEICRQSDAAHWARARAAGWSWNMLKEYLWSSLQVRHIPRCPRCDAPLPAGQVVHWSCLLYRSRWLLAVVILALGIIVTGLLFTGTGITK